MDMTDYNALSTLLNTTYGKASSPDGTHSLKAQFSGNNIDFTFTTVVHFAEEQDLHQQTRRLENEAIDRISALVKGLKADFKEMTGKPLKMKESKTAEPYDSTELISGHRSMKKVAYYRRCHTFELTS